MAIVAMALGVLAIVLVLAAAYGSHSSQYVADDICAQTADAAHYIAARSMSATDVVRVTREVIADQRYPLLGDQVVAATGAVVALQYNHNSPEEIAQSARATCVANAK